MHRFFILVFAAAMLLTLGCDPAVPVSVGTRPASLNRMPRTNFPMPPTKPLEKLGWIRFDNKENEIMDEFKGKVVLLDFWATYCPPCIKAIPHLRELDKEYGDDLVVIGLHVGGEEDRKLIPEFRDRHSIDYLIATPEDELTYTLLGNDDTIPQTVIFDRKGKQIKKFIGYDDVIKKDLDSVIKDTVEQ